MDDLISRQAAIDAIRDMQAFEDDNGQPYLYLYDVMAVFTDEEELPTIHPEPHWIPVTGRLPEVGKNVLLSYFDEITIGWLNNDGLWSIYDGWKCVNADEVSAWMPLTEPFKGVTE